MKARTDGGAPTFADLLSEIREIACSKADAWTRAHGGNVTDEEAEALAALLEGVGPGRRSNPRADADIQAKAAEAADLARAGKADDAEAVLLSVFEALPRLGALSAEAAGDLALAVASHVARLQPSPALVGVANLHVARARGLWAVL